MKTNESLVLRQVGLDLEPFEKAEQIAARLAKSTLLPKAIQGKPADLAVIMITGHELGLSPMQALRGLHVVEGRPILSADLIVGLVKKHPACKYFRLIESTDEKATYETQREGEPEPTRITWTIQQASKAGLTGRQNWKAHPAAMLRARASAALARAVYPDVAMGIYDQDEALDFIEVSRGVSVSKPRVEPRAKAPPPPSVPKDEEIVDAVLVEPEADPFEADAARNRARPLFIVSSHSFCGSESWTMPAPRKNRMRTTSSKRGWSESRAQRIPLGFGPSARC
mgnify:CR=1 FL=1